jgi:hypothetical protein
MTIPKQQHWVPRFYLRYFATPETAAGDEPQVWILSKDEGEPKLTNIRKIATKNYLYSPKGAAGKRDQEMEMKLGDGEALLKKIWPRVASDFTDFDGDHSIRKALALFISLLFLRHPRRLRETEAIHRQLVDLFDTIPKDQNGNPDVFEIEHKGVVRQFDSSDWNRYKKADSEELKKMFVGSIKSEATYLAEILMKKRWSVVFSDRPAFVTTDAPVMMLNSVRERFGFASPGTVVSFPLSPTRVLMMDDRHDQPAGRYYPLADTGPGIANGLAWRNCERFMISPRHPDDVCAEILASAG